MEQSSQLIENANIEENSVEIFLLTEGFHCPKSNNCQALLPQYQSLALAAGQYAQPLLCHRHGRFGFDTIFCSDEEWCRDTLEHFLEGTGAPKGEILHDDRINSLIREKDFGPERYLEYLKVAGSSEKSVEHYIAEHPEFEDLFNRRRRDFISFLWDLQAPQYHGRRILVCSHVGTRICSALIELNLQYFPDCEEVMQLINRDKSFCRVFKLTWHDYMLSSLEKID